MKKYFFALTFVFSFFLTCSLVVGQNYQLLYQNFDLPLTSSLNNPSVGNSVGPNKWIINNVYSGLSIYPNTISQDSTYIGQISGAPFSMYLHIFDSGFGASQGIFNCSYDPSVVSDNFVLLDSNGVCTVGSDTVYFSFFYTCTGDTNNAYGQIYYSKNSGPWTQTGLPQYVNKTLWKYELVTDPAFNNAANLRFGFRWVNNSSASPVTTAMGIDDVQIVVHYDSLASADTLTVTVLYDTVCSTQNQFINILLSDTMCDGIYNVQLSDLTGNFGAPTSLGLVNLFYPQTNFFYAINIPTNVFPGNCYRIRLMRMQPQYPPLIINASGCFTVMQCPNTVTTLQPIVTYDTNAVCAGSVIDVPFYSTGTYQLNSYIAQLSNANGTFPAWPQPGTVLGTFVSDITYDPLSPTPGYPPPGNVAGLIPDTVSPGCNYYIRVIGTGPAVPPSPTIGTVWGPFCIQRCDMITNNEQDIHMCVISPGDSCIQVPVNINFYNSTVVYAPGNQFRVQLISRGPIPPPMTEVGLPAALGSITATNDNNLTLCIYADSLAAWGIPPGSYYLRVVATNSSVPENSLGTIVRFTFGNPAAVAPSFSAYDWPSLTPLTGNSVCMGDYVLFQINPPYNFNSTYDWLLNSSTYNRPPNSFLVWFNGAGNATIRLRENNFGCLGPLSPPTTITTIGPPNVNIVGPSSVCVGDTVQYSVPLGNSTFYLWTSTGGTLFTSGSNQAQIVFGAPGTDTLYVTATNQCTTDSSFRVINVYASPPVPLLTQNGDTLTCSVSGGVTYRWYRNGILQPQYTTQSIVITPAENGNWHVEVRNIAPPFCASASTLVQTDVGINELTHGGGIVLIPNPATDELSVGGFSGNGEINIYNMLGEKVFVQPLTTNNKQQTINISNLPAGIYVVKVNGEKEEHVAKFVKE